MSQFPSWWSLALVLAVSLGSMPLAAQPPQGAAAGSARRPITPEDLWAMERVGDPALSPDGQWVVFTVTRFSVEENRATADLWLGAGRRQRAAAAADLERGQRRLAGLEPGRQAPSPSSPSAATRRRSSTCCRSKAARPQPVTELPVGVQDPQAGSRTASASPSWRAPGRTSNDDWPAVKKRLDERKDDKTQAKISDEPGAALLGRVPHRRPPPHLFAVDLASRQVDGPHARLQRASWTSCRRRATGTSPRTARDRLHRQLRPSRPTTTLNCDVCTSISAASGRASRATSPPPTRRTTLDPRYSPDGRYLVYGRNRRPEIEPDFTHLARYDRQSGEVRGLAEEWDAQAGGWSFTPDGKTLLFQAEDHGRVHALSPWPIDGGAPRAGAGARRRRPAA